jgi:hypothetical protein
MVKNVDFTFEEMSGIIHYNPETGDFTRKVTTSSRALAGQKAGVWQRMQNGKDYFSVTHKGRKIAGAQLAWLLHYGEWPDRSVFYIDEDPKNLRISNLKMADYKAERVLREDGSVKYKMSKEQSRHYGYLRYYNITAEDYAKMFSKQDGKCAICHQPETVLDKNGETKILAVDHCHVTDKVRELLCYACNSMLGQARDKIETLEAGIAYLKKHSADTSAEHPGSLAPSTGPADTARTMERNLVQEER